MSDFSESLLRLGAHSLGGRIGRDQIGVPLLQVHQFPVQEVELRIGDDGVFQHMITVVVKLDLLAQLGDALGGIHGIGLLDLRNIAVRASRRHDA